MMQNHSSFGLSFLGAVIFTMATFLSGCSQFNGLSEGGAELAQSPITDTPSNQRFPGRFVWHDLLTPDLTAAGSFYEQLFGWQIEYKEHSAVVRNNGKRIAGIMELQSSDKRARAIWIPSVSVADVDATLGRVKDNNGKVLNGPVDMGKRGRAALVRDFQGADIVLLKARGGDPVQTEAAAGDWLWDEIWTNNPGKTENFYTAVLGYDDIVSAKEDYGVFAHGEEWVAGIRHLQENTKDPLWVPVVRVVDPEAAAKRAEALGGVIWVAPDQAPSVGKTALIGDPTGALLLIQYWSSQTSDTSN